MVRILVSVINGVVLFVLHFESYPGTNPQCPSTYLVHNGNIKDEMFIRRLLHEAPWKAPFGKVTCAWNGLMQKLLSDKHDGTKIFTGANVQTLRKQYQQVYLHERIPSTTPGAEPPRDARDSGSARSHSTHLETSSSDRPKWSPTRSSTRYQDQISVKCTRRTLRMPSFTHAAHAQPSLSNFPRWDSNFGEQTRSRGMTLGERNFPTSPQNKKTKLTHCSIYVPMRTISTSHAK